MLIKIKTTDGNTYNIKNSNIISSKYQSDCSDDNEIVLGFASASSFNFSIKSLDGLYENINFLDSKIELWNDEETVRKGIFNLNKIIKKRHVISFETLDNMTKFDERFKGATFPLTVLDFIKVICLQCNVPIGETITSLVNSNTIIKSSDEFIGKNCREILQLLCELTGNFAIIDKDGKLQLKWFDFKTIKKEIPYKELHDLELEEINTKVSGVEVYMDNEKYDYSTGGTYNLYLSENNPFFLDSNQKEIRLYLKNIYESHLSNMDYYSFNLKTRIDYNIEVGDVIKVQDEKGNYHLGVVSNLEFNNDSNMIINSAGENREREYNATSRGGAGSSQEQKVSIIENLNFRNYSIEEGKYQSLNSFNIENVNNKSEVFFNYLCEFTCIDGSYNLDFDFYVNDIKAKSINFIESNSVGVFNVGFKLALDLSNDINTIIVNLRSNTGTIDIDRMKSSVTVIATNCSPDGGGNQSEIRVSDNLEKVTYSLYQETDNGSFFIIKDIREVYNILLKNNNTNSLNEIVELYDLLADTIDLTIDNINVIKKE